MSGTPRSSRPLGSTGFPVLTVIPGDTMRDRFAPSGRAGPPDAGAGTRVKPRRPITSSGDNAPVAAKSGQPDAPEM